MVSMQVVDRGSKALAKLQREWDRLPAQQQRANHRGATAGRALAAKRLRSDPG